MISAKGQIASSKQKKNSKVAANGKKRGAPGIGRGQNVEWKINKAIASGINHLLALERAHTNTNTYVHIYKIYISNGIFI